MLDKGAKCIIAVAGGSGSGKSTLIAALAKAIGTDFVAVLSHDDYYKDQSHIRNNDRHHINFDHPDALDSRLLIEHIVKLRNGSPVAVPVYDFKHHTRCKTTRLDPKPIVIVDGILLLVEHELRENFDIKIYIDTDEDVRFIRRQQRDIAQRGRTAESVAQQWISTVKLMHDQFVEPSRAHADIIVSGNGDQREAIKHLLSHLRSALSIIKL
jgi:uridine kinase